VKAGQDCLRASNYNPGDVQVLINTGIYRDGHYAEPAIACFIQKKLGINIEFQARPTLSFDLLNGGCGMLNAAHVLTTMIKSGVIQVGMVVSSEANSDRHPDSSYTYPPSGAAFLLDISPLSQQGFGSFVFRTFEEYFYFYGAVVSLAQKKGRIYVRKKAELEDVYLNCAKPVFEELIAYEKLKREDVDLLIPSQISPRFIQKLASILDFPKSKIIDTTHLYADTLTTSFILALKHAIDQSPAGVGNKAVFLAFGSGITVGSAIYYF
jgi:3-oxoacyl-[acyl-carrier-protein] synthase-3